MFSTRAELLEKNPPREGERVISTLKPYPAYKDSGVPWLGKVPEHWEVRRLASCLRSLESGSREQIGMDAENGIPNLGGEHIGRDGQLLLRNMRYISRRYFQSLRKGLVKENDVLLVKDGATIGKVAIVRVMPYPECTVNEHVFILRSAKDCLSGFIYHSMSSQGLQELIWQLVTGSAQPGLNSTFIKGVHLSLPPLPEQTAIVRFLDYMDRRIRRFIRAKQKLIKLLEEYRQALIHQAVTGKIDVRTGQPYSAYKDSGVPWLGKVPEHWEVRRLKRIARLNPSKSEVPLALRDGQAVFLPMERVGADGRYDASELWPISELWNGFTYFRRGDVVVAKITPCFENGKGACLEDLPTPIGFGSTEFHVIRPSKAIASAYLYRITTLSEFRRLGTNEMTGAAGQQRVPVEFIANFPIPIPPLPEQTAIVEYLDAQTARLDAAMAATRREIELLREYRTRLIADVVTGKLDVREIAAQLPEETEEETEPLEEETTPTEETDGEESEEETDGEE